MSTKDTLNDINKHLERKEVSKLSEDLKASLQDKKKILSNDKTVKK